MTVCAFLCVVLSCALHGVDAEALSEAKCEDLGFTGLALCSDCDSLAEYVKDQGDLLLYSQILFRTNLSTLEMFHPRSL